MNAYCVKCKAKKPMADGVESVLKNGRKAIKGKCSACGTGMFKIQGTSSKPASTAEPLVDPQADKPATSKPSFRFTFFQE
jgi:uncharacterized Zn finger protein (UPF0148 family)